MKYFKFLLFIAIISAYGNIGFSQPIANFTIDKNQGCPPFTVNFTNTSAPLTGTETYAWNFGDGRTSTLPNPSMVYSNPGSFSVTLTVNDGVHTPSSKTLAFPIKVLNLPVANFSADKLKGCLPLSITFTDLSTPGDGPISSWLWVVNGTTKTDLKPTYNINSVPSEGKQDASLTITDSYGCTASATKIGYLDLAKPPQASFVADQYTPCKSPSIVQFTNYSTGLGVLRYSWSFGDGATLGNVKNTPHTYTGWNAYTVRLTVNSDYAPLGCENYGEITVTLSELKAAGTLISKGVTLQNNAYICAYDEVSFTNLSTGASNIAWDFGDNNTELSNPNPTHAYSKGGTYTVKLTASRDANCTEVLQWIINVEEVTARFNMIPIQSCSSPVNVQFNNTSTNGVNYLWSFDDGTTSTETNPLKTVTMPGDLDAYVIHQPYNLKAILTATGAHGCQAFWDQQFTISRPTALFSIDTASGCPGLKVNFTDKSISDNAVTSFKWVFGDGQTATTATSTTSHTYSTTGEYLANLIITNASGCKDTSYNIPIKIGKTTSPSFTLSTGTSVCPNEAITVNNTTSDDVDYWKFTVNGIAIDACPEEKNPTFQLNNNYPSSIIKLTAGNNGCYTEATPITITNKGPRNSFTYNLNCTSKMFSFYGASTAGALFQWDFGDGNSSSSLSPTHTYNTSVHRDTNYLVQFTASLNGCDVTTSQTVRVRQIDAIFTAPPKGCANDPVSFDGTASHTSKPDICRDKYIWNFNDASPLIKTDQDKVSHSFQHRGTYKVTVTALYANGCTDTVSHSIRIFQPYAKLSADTTKGCIGDSVKFTDKSTQDVNALKNFALTYGDVGQDVTTIPGHVFLPKHPYKNAGVFNAVLTATDSIGCKGTDTIHIKIGQPIASFYVRPNGCANENIQFEPNLYSPDSVVWTFGDGYKSKSVTNPVTHAYKSATPFEVATYHVKLKVYQYYCKDSTTQDVYIMTANAKFTASDTLITCPEGGKVVTFTHSYPSSEIESGLWSLGYPERTFSYLWTDPTKSYTYLRAGYDTARLSIKTKAPYSCAASYSKLIRVLGPEAKLTISPDTACKGSAINFTLHDTINITSFRWNFGDGNIINGTSLSQSHAYSSIGKIKVSVELHNKTCELSLPDSVFIKEVIARFTVKDTAVCESIPIVFTNNSLGTNQLKWTFGDGATSTQDSPTHAYAAGKYTVKLTVVDAAVGCKDSTSKVMTVNVNPAITVALDKLKCPQNIMILHATGGDSISWWPPQGLNNANIYNPEATPKSSTYYRAKVINKATKCFRTDSLLVTRANIDLRPTDTLTVIGDPVQIRVISSSDINTYIWTSSIGTGDLSCTNCLNPLIRPSGDVQYILLLTEPNNCFNDTAKVSIRVDWDNLTFGMPSAFTPNRTEINSTLKVRGRGIKELLEYKIYNRWGHLVFSTTDRTKGWDGKFNGQNQPIDTYVWTVIVRTYDDQIVKKQGTVLLMR